MIKINIDNYKSKEEACSQLCKDIKLFTGKLEKVENLIQGSGEWVCFVINDLLNWELIKKDFWFLEPKIKEEEGKGKNNKEDEWEE